MKNWSTESIAAAKAIENHVETQDFSIGDIVYLKSGSSPMTINNICYSQKDITGKDKKTITHLACYWYDYRSATLHKDEIPVMVLTKTATILFKECPMDLTKTTSNIPVVNP